MMNAPGIAAYDKPCSSDEHDIKVLSKIVQPDGVLISTVYESVYNVPLFRK